MRVLIKGGFHPPGAPVPRFLGTTGASGLLKKASSFDGKDWELAKMRVTFLELMLFSRNLWS